MKRKHDPTPSSGGEEPRRIAPEDIQAKEFRMARLGGYKERDVDEFLDELTGAWTALLEENRRLLRQAGGTPAIGGPELADATRRAENIIRRSHEEAAQVLREAETRAGAIAAAAAPQGERAALSAFLKKERAFLQSLAALGQDHAEGLKEMARELFSSGSTAATPDPSSAATPPVEASSAPWEEPETAERLPETAEEGEPAASGSEEEPSEKPIRIEEPEPAIVRATEDDPKTSRETSLRELFWGEE